MHSHLAELVIMLVGERCAVAFTCGFASMFCSDAYDVSYRCSANFKICGHEDDTTGSTTDTSVMRTRGVLQPHEIDYGACNECVSMAQYDKYCFTQMYTLTRTVTVHISNFAHVEMKPSTQRQIQHTSEPGTPTMQTRLNKQRIRLGARGPRVLA